MFAPTRFVVVDDKPEHLRAIVNTFQLLGSPCIGIHFSAEAELDPAHFRGVRVLFLDLHLIEGGALGTDQIRHYASIASILENNISPQGGPFVLVIWTAYPERRQELVDYLDGALDQQKPHARPLAVLCLEKERFINLGSGDVVDPAQLRLAVEGTITSNAQLAALLNWETDVLAAAGATLSELVGLVPPAQRLTAAFPAALNVILSRLAREAVGRPNVAVNHRAAIATALAPILADRIMNQTVTLETSALWMRAVTRHDDPALGKASPEEAGRINRMLHLSVQGSETIRPTDWGAVVDFPGAQWNSDDELRRVMGATRNEILEGEFKIRAADQANCRPCLVRVGAACDHAQGRPGPLTYLLALEIPKAVKRDTPPASEWISPVLVTDGVAQPFELHVNARFGMSLPAVACETWQVRYRLREQLLMHLVSHANVYASRPGIVQLPV